METKTDKEIMEQMDAFKKDLEQMKVVVTRLDEQAEKRIEARIRERELEARILEAKNKWRPKDWFILSGIVGAVLCVFAGLAVTVVLAFSYVPKTSTTTTVTAPAHEVNSIADNNSTNNISADFVVK